MYIAEATHNCVRLNTLKNGDSFEYNYTLFMKTEIIDNKSLHINCVNLSNGELHMYPEQSYSESKLINILKTINSSEIIFYFDDLI